MTQARLTLRLLGPPRLSKGPPLPTPGGSPGLCSPRGPLAPQLRPPGLILGLGGTEGGLSSVLTWPQPEGGKAVPQEKGGGIHRIRVQTEAVSEAVSVKRP